MSNHCAKFKQIRSSRFQVHKKFAIPNNKIIIIIMNKKKKKGVASYRAVVAANYFSP